MFCTTISGFPGMCLPRYCATKRPQSSWAPPTEFPTMSLIDLLLKNSSDAACARLERRANPIKKDTQKKILFIRPPSSSQCVERLLTRNKLLRSRMAQVNRASLNQASNLVSSRHGGLETLSSATD